MFPPKDEDEEVVATDTTGGSTAPALHQRQDTLCQALHSTLQRMEEQPPILSSWTLNQLRQ